jgi:hypothetical protein
MENVTLLLQGHVKQEVLDFFLEYYPDLKIILSTWFEHVDLVFPESSHLPPNFKLIQSKQPANIKGYSIFYQLVSTMNGLRHVDTKYVIKLRGDEFISRIEYILEKMEEESDVIYTLPIFFKKWNAVSYHISDHLIAGRTDNVRLMFEGAKSDYDANLFDTVTFIPEQVITLAYLKRKHNITDFGNVDGPELMRNNFRILDMTKLIPYKIVANCFKKTWYSNFIPEQNDSISDLKDL